MGNTSSATTEKKKIGHFINAESEQDYLRAYDEVMDEIAAPTKIYDVETPWGIVRVYKWDSEKGRDVPPVILLPGHSSGAPMWQVNIPGFVRNHTVYALDALGDAGKSVQTEPLQKRNDVSDWMCAMMDKLKIKRAHIVGHSFGGGYAAHFTREHRFHVATLTLIEPAFALNYPLFSVLFWASVVGIPIFPKSWRDYGLKKITGADAADLESDDPLSKMIQIASTYYKSFLPTPKPLSAADIKDIKIPVYVALADISSITGTKAAKRADTIPNGVTTVWKNTTHSLPMEVPEELAMALNEFWQEADELL